MLNLIDFTCVHTSTASLSVFLTPTHTQSLSLSRHLVSPQLKYHDPALDARVKLTQEVVRVIRSMKQDYLPAKAKPEVHLVCHTPEASDILSQFVGVVTTLSQCSKSV